MRKHYLKLMPAGIFVAALLSGCGGDSSVGSAPSGAGGGGGSAALAPAPDLSQSVADLYAYMVSLIAGTSDSSSPVDINGTELAVDNVNDGVPVN